MKASDQLAIGGARIPPLDGLRGLAILFVILHHLTYYGGMTPEGILDRAFYAVTFAGWIGVDLFFVLSGFLITGILLDTKEGQRYFLNFFARRVLRIFPLYYGCLAFAFLVLPRVVQPTPAFDSLLSQQAWFWTYTLNVKIAFFGWPEFEALSHFWSLAIEEQFYLVWPFVVFLCGTKNLLRLLVAFMVLSPALRTVMALFGQSDFAYVFTPARIDTLAVGALLAVVGRSEGGFARIRRHAGKVALASGLALSLIFAWRGAFRGEDEPVYTLGLSLIAALFGAVLGLAVTAPSSAPLPRFLSNRHLAFLGRYSYALYVFHQPVILLMREHAFSVASIGRLFGSQLPGQALFSLACMAPTLLLALASWRFYESPFLRLKRLFR